MTSLLDRGAFTARRMKTFARGAAMMGAFVALLTMAVGAGDEALAASGKAKLVLKRISSVLYVGVPASVKVNGNSVATLWAGNTETVEIAPGKSAVSVGTWSYPASWTVHLNAQAGRTYTLEISPRAASFGPALLGPIGGVIESNGGKNEKAGVFELKVVRP